MFNKNKPPKTQPLSALSGAPTGVFVDPRDEFAEIYGSAKVGQQRMFLVALGAIGLAVCAVISLFTVAQNNVAIPWLVEVNPDSGLVNKPIRIESMKPSQAVLKAELKKWIVKVFTIDAALTPQAFREANTMTRGLGTQQFTAFRVDQKIMERMAKDATLQRKAIVNSVDTSQNGVAFIFLSTQESLGSDAKAASARYRVTLKYELTPPTTESEILDNPLGIYVTSMNATEEGANK